jgi:hypothetical protein
MSAKTIQLKIYVARNKYFLFYFFPVIFIRELWQWQK